MEAGFSVVVLWIAFAGSHLVLSSARVRPALVLHLGLRGFLGLYSLVALATFVPLVRVFAAHKHAGPLLWLTLGPPAVARGLNYMLMAVAFALLIASLLPGSTPPSAMQARGPVGVQGLTRITRHPTLAAFGLFGLAHLLVNGTLGDLGFFGGFPLFAWLGAAHQDGRKSRDLPGYGAVVAATSVIPFAAVLAGRQRLVGRELPLAGLAAGVALAVVIRLAHPHLFGP